MSDYKLIDVTRLTKFKEKLLGILAYTSPAADATNTSIEFIDTVSQSNGKISASKKKVSTFEGGNTVGLVPAPGANASGTFLGSDGKWSKPTGTTYNNYTTSTTDKAGANGLVPAPGTGDVGKFLKGGSGWSDLPTASTTNSGIVSLDSSTNSNAENVAATPKAVNDVYTAAVNAASNAGANAASSYATAAKNSADSAAASAADAADAASTAVTNAINGLSGSTPAASGDATSFVTDVTQTKGKITVSKSSIPTASTKTAGIVKLTDTTGSTDTTTAATPNSVTSAINDLTGSVTDSTTETSTTFISDISQTKGVVTATKKKLPTFAGSSQPGIVSASEGLSENYLLNATGGWTSIDEELDPDSTNPVQNKTLYNLETYHTLTDFGDGSFVIDDGSIPFDYGNSVKLFVPIDIMNNSDFLMIKQGLNYEPKKVWTCVENTLTRKNVNNIATIPSTATARKYLGRHSVFNFYDGAAGPIYTRKFFSIGIAIELILTHYNGDEGWVIIGDPVVGRYKYNYIYTENQSWNITANAVVYASGLKIQWGNFTHHSASGDELEETFFPVAFDNVPSMSFTFDTNVGSGSLDADVIHRDTPYAASSRQWKLHAAANGTYGYWQAIGY